MRDDVAPAVGSDDVTALDDPSPAVPSVHADATASSDAATIPSRRHASIPLLLVFDRGQVKAEIPAVPSAGAMNSELVDAIWQTIEPIPEDDHPLGRHDPSFHDRICLGGSWAGWWSSWTDIEAIINFEVPDTTLRARRDEWIDAGVFDRLAVEALAAYNRIIELDVQRRGTKQSRRTPHRLTLGLRWIVAGLGETRIRACNRPL